MRFRLLQFGPTLLFLLAASATQAAHKGPVPDTVLLKSPQVQEPVAAALDRGRNRLYVADAKAQNVFVLQVQPRDLEYALENVSFQSEDGARFPFDRPQAVAAPPGMVAVGDAGTGRVTVFREDGAFIRELKASAPFSPPFAMAADPRTPGDLWVADRHRLYHFEANGTTTQEVPYADYGLESVVEPGGMWVSQDGRIWLTASKTGQLLQFTPGLKEMKAWPLPGLKSPSGIVVPDPDIAHFLLATSGNPVTAFAPQKTDGPGYADATQAVSALRGSPQAGLAWDRQDRLIVTQGGASPRVLSIRGEYIRDTDHDRLSDAKETYVHETDPTKADTDGDGLNDYDEIWATDPTDPLKADMDGDGLTDRAEVKENPPTNPYDANDPLPGPAKWLLAIGGSMSAACVVVALPFLRRRWVVSPITPILAAAVLGAGVALAVGGWVERVPKSWLYPLLAVSAAAGVLAALGSNLLIRKTKGAK